MKKVLFTLLLGFVTVVCNGQIYSKIEHYDKFDDCTRKENIKTLINIDEDDGIITVETKGRKIVEYLIFTSEDFGKEDSIINLVNGIYGYQKNYYCIELKDTANWRNENRKKAKELLTETNPNFSDERIENIIKEDSVASHLTFGDYIDLMVFCKYENKYIKEIVDRHVSWFDFKWDYRDRLFWIKYSDGSRIIYRN